MSESLFKEVLFSGTPVQQKGWLVTDKTERKGLDPKGVLMKG